MNTATSTRAFIIYHDKVLIIRESKKYLNGSNIGRYDLPGGKIEPGERFDVGLRREVYEESGLNIDIGRPFFVSEWRPTLKGEEWQITGIFFECFASDDKVRLSSDHDEYLWVDPENFEEYDLIKENKEAFKTYLELKNKSRKQRSRQK